MVLDDDRRQFQRLKLARPIIAAVDGASALLLDVGVAGAFVEHHGRLEPGTHFSLTFRWQGDELEFECEVARTKVVRPSADAAAVVSHSGVRFVDASAGSSEKLRQMMATFVGRVLAAQRANASGDHDSEVLLGTVGEARRARSRGFVRYQFREGAWSHEATQSPRQPPNGFTVGAFEDDDEIEQLCRTYENADEEGRDMIRLVAELSTASVKKS
jgi:hypothetical protein